MYGRYAGWHLTVDGLVGPGGAKCLADVAYLDKFLRDLVGWLDMKILGGPHLHEVETKPELLETEEDEGGVTGCVVITTSHISIHTWPLRKRFSLDIYSCKRFDSERASAFISERLGVTRQRVGWSERSWPET